MAKIKLIIFTLFTALIIWSGVTARLGFTNVSLWPWKNQWYMFSYSTDYIYKLRATGYGDSNIRTIIPLENYFRYPASQHTHRADEIRPHRQHYLNLAAYLCKKNPGIYAVEFTYALYRKRPGEIPDLANTPDFVQPTLSRTPCQRTSADAD